MDNTLKMNKPKIKNAHEVMHFITGFCSFKYSNES